MTPTSSAALKASLSMLFTGTLVIGGLSTPAMASPKDRPAKAAKASAKASSKPSAKAAKAAPAVTEDNDNDGVANNVVDSGDNKHPSGKDRSVEKGGSANQGKSASDPDRSNNGGADKPGGAGGVDKHDQDGNNGCGNDDDFEDDNNGNCGGRRGPKVKGSGNQRPANQAPANQAPGNQASGPGGTSPGTTTPTGDAPVIPPAAVLGIEVNRPATVAPLASFPQSDVLGVGLSRLSDPAASLSDLFTVADESEQSRTSGSLPRTGSGASDLAQLALILLGAGGTLMVTSRRRPTAATRV